MEEGLNRRERLLLFGAGSAGRAYFNRYQNQYEILAFIDNDPARAGQSFCGRPVIGAGDLVNWRYDAIVITSIFVFQIERQLRDELKVEPAKIRFSPKEVLDGKSLRPFEDEATARLARTMILYLSGLFERAGVWLFLDHGTLLGGVREGDLLSWDDDVDFSILAEQSDEAIRLLEGSHGEWPMQADLHWSLTLGVQEGEEPSRRLFLTLAPERGESIRYFTIEISINHLEGGSAVQMLNRAPAHHFGQRDWLRLWGERLAVPHDTPAYLTQHYGDWQTPRRGISFHEIPSFIEPVAPTKRLRLR